MPCNRRPTLSPAFATSTVLRSISMAVHVVPARREEVVRSVDRPAGRSSLPLAELAHLVAVAAAFHRAPAPAAGAGGVDEDELAVVAAAHADARRERSAEQLDGLPCEC